MFFAYIGNVRFIIKLRINVKRIVEEFPPVVKDDGELLARESPALANDYCWSESLISGGGNFWVNLKRKLSLRSSRLSRGKRLLIKSFAEQVELLL